MGSGGSQPLFGLMQDWPLTTDKFIEHANRWHPRREVVSRLRDGQIERRSYAEMHAGAKRVSAALVAHGIRLGDRVATLAMNSADHLAAWYGISGIGAVYHTLNPRLFLEQLTYIVNHAHDRLIFADGMFAQTLEGVLPRCPGVELVVFLNPPPQPVTLPVPAVSLAEFVAGHDRDVAWGDFDERSACGLCYTSGTTGLPKGVLYSHRSNFLHALTAVAPDVLDLAGRDNILAIVPMFHANAWGLAFSSPSVGANLILPGPRLDGASVHELIINENVTFAAGVPTVWLGLLDYLDANGLSLGTLERIIIGGAAMPEVMLHRFTKRNIEVTHAWGMTEMSPMGTVCSLSPEMRALPFEKQVRHRMKQGRAPFSVDMRLVSDDGVVLPHDAKTVGHLQVRGPGVTRAYLGEEREAIDTEGWFDTGDIATICPQGFMQITDRAKDVIKSGGEWISSLEIESAVSMHPKVALAAAVGVPHPKWDERPVLYLTLKPGMDATPDEFIEFLRSRVAKWWLPDAVYFLDEIPVGGTGKVDKKVLRAKCLAENAALATSPA
ncbi:MAG TPA: long-chain-fatty-acid--CoA ligase [Alphaproteobacteria bacterium]|jgi:fatty-acyl-CoA synthase|nr:long-chain-fatty-acid--CoA ligase [Alphaproteobacteria bacterium]